jgi:hypothetical protein
MPLPPDPTPTKKASKKKQFLLVDFQEERVDIYDNLETIETEIRDAIETGQFDITAENFRVFEIVQELPIKAEKKLAITFG